MPKQIDRGLHYFDSYAVEGDRVRVEGRFERTQEDAWFTPGAEISVDVFAHGAPIQIRVAAWPMTPQPGVQRKAGSGANSGGGTGNGSDNLFAPSTQFGFGVLDPWALPELVPPPLPSGGPPVWHAPMTVAIYAPHSTEPAQTWDLPEAQTTAYQDLVFSPPGVLAPGSVYQRVGWWRVTVTLGGPDSARVTVSANGVVDRVPLHSRALSTRLFNNVFRLALEALTPRAEITGSQLTIDIGKELAELIGKRGIVRHESLSPLTVAGTARLRMITVDAVSQAQMIAAADTHGRAVPIALEAAPDDIALRIQVAFDKDIEVSADLGVVDVAVATLEGEVGQFFLAFNSDLTSMTAMSFVAVEFSPLVGIALEIAEIFTEVNTGIIDAKIEAALNDADNSRAIRTYLRLVLSRALGHSSVVTRVFATPDGWVAEYFDNPFPDAHFAPHLEPGESTGWAGGLGVSPIVTGGVRDEMSGVSIGGSEPPAMATEPPPASPLSPSSPPPPVHPFGEWPPEFVVAGGPALARLDRVKTLIFVMMENRSFDHLLGDLARVRPRAADRYDGFSADASNPSAAGFAGRVPLVPATAIGLDTAIPVSPPHSIDHVLFQIGGGDQATLGSGAMEGFSRDILGRSDSPQVVMSYYQEAQLPTYYRLADEFRICDRWFAALPGSTWPNRWATFMGTIPELDNFKSDDPRLGFLKDRTIFDALTAYGIDWRIYESNFSFIRMFDTYRLDDHNVLPLHDETDGLSALLRRGGALPRVIFIEPRFVELPPLALASDDHPPADLAHGQRFIADLCDLLWSSGRWGDISLFIMYDEHGGFYDHVPPPGSANGGAEWIGKIAKLHPDGPEMLGVRVPGFVVSPFVSAGSICHDVLDHTSILKTILVHNRAKVPSNAFTSFGPRVNAATHLGVTLDLDSPRAAPDAFRARKTGVPVHPISASVPASSPLGDLFKAPEVGAGTTRFRPIRADPPSESRDFHTALRDALKPRPR